MTNNDDDLGGGAPDFSSFGSPIDTSNSASTPDAAPTPAPRRSAFAWAPDVDDALETASKEFGVDRGLLDTFARIESSGRADARTGSYKGLFQLSDDEFFKHGGQSNPFDPYENARAGAAKLRAEKADFSKRYGRDPNAAELYMIHQQGVGGSAAHWANPDAPAWQNMYSTAEGRQKGANWARRAIWGNVPDDMKRQFGSVDNITSRDFTKLWEDKVARFGGGAAPASAGTTAVAAAATGRPSGMMGLGGAVSDDDDEETEEQFPLPGTDEDDELPSSSEFGDDDGPMYLGGPEPKPDFSRFGKPLGQAATPQGTSKPDFSKFGKPVRDTNDPAADQKPMSNDGYGDGFWENVRNPQQYKELAKGVIPGAISMQGTALQAPDAFASKAQHSARDFGAKQLEVMDRIDRGETVPETEDAFGYQHMGQEDRAKARKDTLEAQAAFNPTPIQDRTLYKAGEAVQEFSKGKKDDWYFNDVMKGLAPKEGYEKSVGRQLGEGLGSMAGGMPYGILGRAPAGLFFGAAGAGEATQRAVEFDKKERKEGRDGLTQEQIALAGIMGIGPGTTDLLPLETLMGRLPLPIPESAKKPLAQAIARIGGQAFIEGLQEGGQQFLQNLIAREVYNPKQELGEDVLGNTGIGAGVGGLAQTGKEVGSGLVKLAGGRRGRAGSAPEAGEDDTQKALPPPAKQITGPAQENMPPPASAEEAGWLRARGFDDKSISEMSPEERAAEIEEAKAQGLKPVAGPAPAPQQAPDNPTAEPVGDLLAQAADLNDPNSDRSGVYIPAAGLESLDEKGVEQLAQAMGDNLVLENFDDKGGHLVVADYETAKKALEAKAAGEDLQKIIGQATGAGSGKPSNGSVVVQQRTKDGNVTRESLVTPDQVDATRKAFARDGHDVEVLSPQEALQRREEMIAAQRAAAPAAAPAPSSRAAPVAIEKPEDVAAVVAPSDYSPAQGEANNRRLGHAKWNGLDISIETDGDNVRRGQTKEGREWKSRMGAPYGYFKNTLGADDMHVDVFVGPNPESDKVYVLDENDKKTGKFRQHKTFIGFDSEADARQAYTSSSNKSEDQIGGITEMGVDEFKDWLADGKKTRPVAQTEGKSRRWDGPELSPDEIDLIVTNWKYVRDVAAMPKPESLAQFVISQGGLRDDAREVRHIMGAAKERPGLVNKDGVTLDDMALKAWESGFFEDSERPTIADFLNKLQDDLHTGAEVRLIDQDALDSIKIAGEIAEELNDYGITASRFRSEASLREYFGQARPKAARAAEDAEGQEAAGREGADAASDIIDEVPFGPEREGQQGAVARDEARDEERAGAVRDREDQDQQGAEPAEGARDSGEDRGPGGPGPAGRGSDVAGARETGPSAIRTFDDFRRERDRLDAEMKAASDKLNAFPKGPMGLTDDAAKKSPEYRKAKADYDSAFAAIRDLNRTHRKRFDKEAREEIDAQRRGEAAPAGPVKAESRQAFIEALMSGVQDRGQEVEAPNGTTYRIDYIPKRQTYVVVSREKDSPASFTKGPAGLRGQWTRPQAAEEAADDAHLTDAPAITTEKSGQTSLVPEPTTKEKIAAEAKAKERKGGNEPMDVGMFGSEKDQTDLVDMAKEEPKKPLVVEGATAIDDASKVMAGMSLAELVDLDQRFQASGFDRSLLPNGVVPMDLINEIATRRRRGETVEPVKAEAKEEPKKPSRLGQSLGDLMGKSGGQAKAVETVAAGAKAPTETAAPVEVSEDVAAALERGKEKARAHVLRLGRQNGTEFGMMVLKDGSTKENAVSGTNDFLLVNFETAPEMWTEPPKTVDFHHNHPKSRSFSRADYVDASKRPSLRRTWVHGHDGSEYWAEFNVTGDILGEAYDIARNLTTTVTDDGLKMARYRTHIIALMLKEAGFINYYADMTPARADERVEAIREAIGEDKIADTVEQLIKLKEKADGLLDRGTGSAGRQSQDVGTAPDQAAETASRPAGSEAGDDVRAAADQKEAARGDDQAVAELTPEEALQQRLIETGFKTIVEARKFAAGLGITGTNKEIDETIEKAVVLAARQIVADTAAGRETFDALLALYENQPNLASRTGTSVANQAYSTPVPLAYVASRLAGVEEAVRVLEPTAGNGALLIEASPSGGHEVFANELDPSRAAALEAQGFNVKSEDASSPDLAKPKSADAVIMNPPFGAVKEGGKSKVFKVDGWSTTTIDHAIALNALKAMTDDGKAVLILGGTKSESTDERRKDYRGKAKREFYARLYKDYNVTDHFTVSGDLYTKQGASWPVDVIVIDGRGQSERKLPAAQPPEILKTWEQVAEKLPNGEVRSDRLEARKAERPAGRPSEAGAKPDGRDGSDRKPVERGGAESVQSKAERDAGPVRAERDRGEPGNARDRGGDVDAKSRSDRDGGRADQPVAAQPVRPRVGEWTVIDTETNEVVYRLESQKEAREWATVHNQDEFDSSGRRNRYMVQRAEVRAVLEPEKKPAPPRAKREAPKGGQAFYEPTSAAASLDTLIPVNMASAARDAMAKVAERHESVDQYVSQSLGYPMDSEGMFVADEDGKAILDKDGQKIRPFSAEQVDALAAAIDNVERGAAFIIGDQTGIGKGRIAAGMLRYAMKKGMVPVFLTEKPDLYGDIFRDLRDIGVPEMLGREPRMFITNAGETITLDEEALAWKQESEEARRNGEPAPKRRGKFLIGGTAAKVQENMKKIANGEDIADVVFTTYDQLNTVKGATTPRRTFLSQIAPFAMIVMDEAHNAGGQAKTGWEKKDAPMNRADFARELAAKARGVMFSSATYAKRPDVMDLYARTDMGKAVDDPKELGELIQRGGVPMQQIVASMLAKSGQYLRRERSFDGVDYQLTPVPVNLKAYKQFSASMQAIFRFDLAVEEFRDGWGQDKLDELGWKKSKDDGVGGGSASSVAFGSLMHNITNQMLLAIKAEQTAQQAIKAHKAGEKPVIALANTNESFIKDFAEGEGIKIGQPLDLDFSAVLERYLERTLRITVKGPENEKKHLQIPIDELPLSLRQEFRAAMNAIKEGDYSSLPISPIDWIRFRLGEAGMSVKEVTGRQTMIDYSKPTPTYVQRPKSEQGASGKRGSIAYFNAGKLDALILNRSGSTGVSMHASSSFKDQRRRRMILAQAEGNIDTHLQMLGRVHRTGQVIPPAYSQIAAEIPAEARPTAVLMKKMASLNANTTGARSSAFTVDSVDFINEVGDKVVADVLMEDPDLNVQLGEPLKFEDGKVKGEEIARKATGRLVLLDPEVQSRFLDQVQKAYLAEIEQLDALGENPLEAKTVDLQAKTIETTELKPLQGDSPFLDAVRMEKVSAKAQGRAMAPSEVAGKIADALKVSKPSGSDAQVLASLESQGRAWGYKETDRVSALIRKQMAEEIAETGADSKESTRRRLEAQYQRWNETMGLVYPGARVRLGMQAGDLDAIVMSVERTGKAKQMGALSAWTVKLAVPDSMRQLEFAMSKLFPPGTPKAEDEKGATLTRAGASHNDLVDAFEQARKEGRETRYIVTGNILGGFDQTRGRGRIVNFTNDKGELRPGILMGREFSAEKFMDNRAVRFQNAGQILEFMEKAPLAKVEAKQGDVELSQYRDTYRIEMASARAKGGMFFTDAAVRRALGSKEFQKRGNKMIADDLTKSEFTKAVAEMQKIGAKFEVRDQQDLAQSIVSKRTGFEEDAESEYRTNKDGFELRLPFKEKWGDPRYNPADREHALARLREIQTMPVRDVPWDDLIQARIDINEITTNLFFYRPDMTDAEVRNYDEVYFYVRDPKGTSKGDPVPSFFRDKMTDERSADLREFQVQGKQALDHMLASRRSGLRDMLFYGPDSGLWTAPKERKAMDPSKVGEKMRSGFYFSAGRKLAEAPDFLFKMNGQAVINWLLKKGVSRDEITHFGLQEKFGQQANDPTPRKFTREEFQKQIADRMFDFRRKVSWLNPERSKNDYELGGTRAFRGPRIPGRGIYFERLMAFPKKLKGGEAFPAGDFISPHWEDEMKNAWASWRGSVREVPGYGKMVVGEEGQTDFMQGANSGRRPRVSGEDYAKLKRDHVRYNKVMDEAYSLVGTISRADVVREVFRNDIDLIDAWRRDMAPSVLNGREYPADTWNEGIAKLREGMRAMVKKHPERDYVASGAWDALDKLKALRAANEEFFAPGARDKYKDETERSFTPETPLDQRYVRTMLRDLLLHAASEKADSIAISTTETNDRIQINTYQSAGHFYDTQLAPRLERELRVLTGDYSLTLEKVALPKAQGHPRNEKAYTVWAAKLPAEVWEKIRTEGLPVLAVGSDLEEAGVPKRTDYKSAIPDIRRAMGSILKSGRPVSINGEVVTAIHKAVDEVRGMVPAGAKVYALARVEPTEDPGTVIAVFEDEDGNEYPLTESWNYLSGIRAAYFEGNLFFVRLSPRALRDVGQFNGSIAAELGHEVTHALRWSGRLSGATWDRLLDHARSLRLLDGEFGTYLKIVGDPSADKVADVTTREVYERLYNTRENRAELMDQEEVAHLVEWYMRGELSRSQVEPVIDILDDIVAGRVQPADREEALEREMAFAAAEQGRAQRRELDRLGFYSKALEAAKDLRQAKGTPEQMRAMLRTAGVKEAEIAATGLDGFLAGKASVTKDEIVQFLRENRVEASEATYQTGADPGNYGQVPFYAEGAAGGPKWASYSIDPSNPTYRETVIHLPVSGTKRAAELLAKGPRNLNAEEAAELDALRARHDAAFQSGHWSEPNVIAHARTSLQKTADGKTVFLVDELQSDWGQKLRDGGVRDEAKIAELKRRLAEAEAAYDKLDFHGMKFSEVMASPEARAVELLRAELRTAEAATPGHPLVNTTDQWTTTAFRRLIRQAVEAGADYIALTPGHVQTERFALSRKIGALRYDPEMKELQYKEVISRTGQVADYYSKFDNGGKPVEAKDLPGIIGKEAAERLLAQPRQYVSAQYSVAGPHTLTELGEIGGSGMKATYDSMYPRTLGKLLEKMDKAAGVVADMPLVSSLDGREFFEAPSAGKPNVVNIEDMLIKFHTFPLTDKVKESVMEDGQPMFAIGGIKAKGAPLSSRNLAESMERKGRDAEFILKNTGWFRGADQKWRFEIDDSAAKIINLDQKVTTPKAGFWRSFTGKRAPGVPEWAGKGVQIGLNIKIPEILSHEKLFNAYPMLRNMRVSIITGAGVPKTHEGGAFIWKEEGGKILYSPIQIKARNKADILPYLMHEIQHYIQRKEGFQGGSASSGRRGEFDTVRLDYNAAPSKQMIFGNEQFSTTTFRSQKDAIGYNERPDWRSHIAGMNAAEQTALAIADLWDALERAPSMRGLISINPETRAFLANKFIEYRDLDRKKADKIDEEAIRDHILPALQAELMSQLRVTAEDYLGSLGEAEANAVMERLNYTPEQRRTMLPKVPKGANSGQVTPDFREAAQAVLDSARKTQAIREKWLMDPVDLGDGVSVQRWRENSLSFSRDEAFDRGAEVAAELDFENGRAIVHFLKHALDGYKVGTKGGYAPLTDAEMTLLADKAEAYVRSINLLPTPDIRLKTDRMDIPQERLSDREIAFWKNRDPFFFAADVSKAVPRNIMAWAWSLDEGELGRMIAPDLVAHIVEARDVVRAEAEEAAQRILDATQEALHGEDSVSAAHQNLIEDARMAELLRAADLNKVEDFRGLLHLYHQRALSKEAAEKTAAGPIEMPMPVDYVTAKLDPEQWRIRDRDAHKEPEAVPVGVWNGHKLSTGTKAQAIVYQDSASNGGVWRGGISGVHLPTMAGTLQTSPPLASMNEAKVWVEKTLQANAIVFDKATGAMASLVRRARLTKNKQSAVSTDLTEAINIVNRIAGREVEVRFSETIAPLSGSTESPLGTYQRPRLRADAIITLATSNEDLLTTAGHEAWHHVEEVLANDAERKLLSSPAEMRRMRAQVADEIGMNASDPRLAQIPGTEIRAIAFQKYRREREEGRQPQGIHIGIRRFWDRMVKILAVVRNALNGHGLKSYEDVFEAARTGEIAQRPAETPSPEARNNAIVRQDEAIAAEPQDVNDVMASLIPRVIKQSVARTMRRFEVSERVDRLRVGIQDKFLPVRRIQEEKERQTGTKIPINLDTYVAEAVFHGRAGKQATDLKLQYIDPLTEVLRNNDISGKQFSDYLYARHAGERNAAIAKIDPGNLSGSGMTDAEANAILAAARGKQAAYDQAAKLVDGMIEATRKRLLASGLITRESYDEWSTKFANYVPLRGFEAGTEEPGRPRTGRGFDIRGPESMQALGRRSKADSPLAYAIEQATTAIIRAEKNRVDKTLYRFIKAYPDPALYQIYKGEYRRRLNPVTKQVESYWVPPQFVRDDAIHGVKIGGKQYYMELKDPRLARAMRGVQGEQHNAVLRGMMTVSRFYASLLTAYNPEFVVSNFMRDIQTALMNVTDVADKPDKIRRQILLEAASFKSMRGVMAALYGREGRTIFGTKRAADENMLGFKRSAVAQDYARWFEEYQKAGGQISFLEFNDVESIQRDINKSIERGRFGRVARKAFGLVNDVNTAVENGVRLSTFIAMRKAGIAPDRAAFVARELTVNFNRKGEWSPYINSMYLFFNASVQGTTRMAQAIAKSRTLQVGVASIMGAAFMFDWWNYMIAGDDDDGKNRWDKLEGWKKERNLIIMTGRADGSYIQIPMPYGYNLFWYGAQQTGAVMRGAVKPHEAAIHVATSMLDVLSPIGGANGSVAQMVAPTLADPFVQVIENKTWYGGPIFPTKYNKNLPDSENAFSSVNPWFQSMARTLNSVTGGNTARKGAIDISPEVIEHFFEFAGGGVAKFINNVVATGGRAANGEEWLPEKTPFVRRVYGKATTESRRRDFYQAWEEVDAAKFEVDNLIKNTRKGTARQDEIEAARQKNAVELQAYGFMRDTQRALSAMRKERTTIELSDRPRAEKEAKLKEIQDRENQIILRSLGTLNRIKKQSKQPPQAEAAE